MIKRRRVPVEQGGPLSTRSTADTVTVDEESEVDDGRRPATMAEVAGALRQREVNED